MGGRENMSRLSIKAVNARIVNAIEEAVDSSTIYDPSGTVVVYRLQRQLRLLEKMVNSSTLS